MWSRSIDSEKRFNVIRIAALVFRETFWHLWFYCQWGQLIDTLIYFFFPYCHQPLINNSDKEESWLPAFCSLHFLRCNLLMEQYYTYKESRKLKRKYPLFHILALLLQKKTTNKLSPFCALLVILRIQSKDWMQPDRYKTVERNFQ